MEGLEFRVPKICTRLDSTLSVALVGALGVGMAAHPGRGIRGAILSPDDPLRWEWDVIVISPHFAGAFVARERDDGAQGVKRRFDFFVTYERELAIEAAHPLLRRIARSI